MGHRSQAPPGPEGCSGLPILCTVRLRFREAPGPKASACGLDSGPSSIWAVGLRAGLMGEGQASQRAVSRAGSLPPPEGAGAGLGWRGFGPAPNPSRGEAVLPREGGQHPAPPGPGFPTQSCPAPLVRGGNEAGRSSLGKQDRGHERYIPVQWRWRAPHSGFLRESLPWPEHPATSLAWPPRLGTKGAQEDRQLPEERTCEASWYELRPRLGEGTEAGCPVLMVPEMVLRCHPLPRL